MPPQGVVAVRGLDDLHVQQIPHGKQRRRHLADDRRHGRTHHAPFADENENGVENDVDDRARQCGDHGEPRAAVGADDGVHGLTEHVKRNAQRDVEEVFLRTAERFRIDRAAEHGNDAVRENEVQRRQNKAACYGQYDGVADAASGVIYFVPAQRHADEGTAAVADHDRDGQRHHRQRENHGIGRVAVGA